MSKFVPRLNADGIWQDKKWYSDSPFYPTYQLPNCTCYAWGRFWEHTGIRPDNLPTGDGGVWFPRAVAAGYYDTGKTPRLGAVACWERKGKAGHVAIVEKINPDGSFVVSQSNYKRPLSSYPPDMSDYFFITNCSASGVNDWLGSSFQFQGFIYPRPDPVPTIWISGNRYLTRSEMTNNAKIIWAHWRARGWTESAIAAILGNMEAESTINPGRWESGQVNPRNGYGLVQWTPSTKLTDWITAQYPGAAFDDGNVQLERIEWEKRNGGQYYPTNSYPESFNSFVLSEKSPEYLAAAWVKNYERPTDQSQSVLAYRGRLARAWYDLLSGTTPPASIPTWLVLAIKKRKKDGGFHE